MRIFDMLKQNQHALLEDKCLDIIGSCYKSLGQKPSLEDMRGMKNLFYNDVVTIHRNMTLEEIEMAMFLGLRNADAGTSVFINVRTWNVWLNDFKKEKSHRLRTNQATQLEQYKTNVNQIGTTINKAKRLK